MSLQTIVEELLSAGFILEQLVEALRTINPDAYDQLHQNPSLLAVRLRRP